MNVHSPLPPQMVGISLKVKYPSNLFLKSILRAVVNYEVEDFDYILGIQLWEVHKYSNGLLVFNEAKSPFTKEPLTAIAKRNPAAKRITEEIKVYSEDDLLEIAEDKVKELYQELKVAIINLGTDVEVRPTKRICRHCYIKVKAKGLSPY